MKWLSFDGVEIKQHFQYHDQQYVKINDREAERLTDGWIKPFFSSTIVLLIVEVLA